MVFVNNRIQGPYSLTILKFCLTQKLSKTYEKLKFCLVWLSFLKVRNLNGNLRFCLTSDPNLSFT